MTGSLLGTLRYMPPEQLKHGAFSLDQRADVYSLSVTFYELIAGQPFFDGTTGPRLFTQVLR